MLKTAQSDGRAASAKMHTKNMQLPVCLIQKDCLSFYTKKSVLKTSKCIFFIFFIMKE